MLYVEPDENDAHFYRNAQADELVYVSKGSGTLETRVRRPALSARATTSSSTAASCTATGSISSGEPTKLLVIESRGHVRWPKRYRNEFGQLIEGAPYSERDIRRPTAAPHPRREGRLPHPGEAVRRAQRDHARPPSVRRGRLGRVLLSLGVQHPRLRADRRTGAPAAAGAPDLPGRRLRGLQLLPAAVRLPSRGGAGAVQPQQRGLGRGALLRLERVHEPEGNRVRQHHAPSRRHSRTGRIRAAPRRASAPSTPTSWR